jgi:L-fuconolactonase
MARLAALPNACCKVSGLVVAPADRLAPFVRPVLEWFGEDRVLFGSDWPVCLLGASYEEIMGRLSDVTAGLAPAAREALLGGNAARVYRLEAPSVGGRNLIA